MLDNSQAAHIRRDWITLAVVAGDLVLQWCHDMASGRRERCFQRVVGGRQTSMMADSQWARAELNGAAFISKIRVHVMTSYSGEHATRLQHRETTHRSCTQRKAVNCDLRQSILFAACPAFIPPVQPAVTTPPRCEARGEFLSLGAISLQRCSQSLRGPLSFFLQALGAHHAFLQPRRRTQHHTLSVLARRISTLLPLL